jgi:tetratricopeptide (TPR) repeat protein
MKRLIVALLVFAPSAWAQMYCGELKNSFGPYDYTNPEHRGEPLDLVESGHFTPNVESLMSAQSGMIGGDLDYTLRAFPNHHRALQSMMRLSQREKKAKPAGAQYTVDCYFDRALRFKPDDPIVLMLHGMFLNTRGRLDEAIQQIEKAVELNPKDANIHYNLGLLYFDKKNFAKSKQHAKIAYANGFPLPGLKNKLAKAGHWD